MNILIRFFVVGFFVVLSGCGGGSGSSSTGGDPGTVTQTEVTIQGSVGDGPIVGATVSVYDNKGTLLVTQQSDTRASYRIKVKGGKNIYPLTIKATGGTDLVTNTVPDFTLYSTAVSPSNTNVNINPYSTVIYHMAKNMGGLSDGNVAAARDIVLTKLNFGVDTNIIADPINTTIDAGNIAHIVKSSETLAEMLRRTHGDLDGIGVFINQDSLIEKLSADLSDGHLDGAGGSSSDARIAALARINSAIVLAESMNNKLKVNGVVSTQAMDDAILTTHSDAAIQTSTVPVPAAMLTHAIELVYASRKISTNTALQDMQTLLQAIAPNTIASQIAALDTSGLVQVKTVVKTADNTLLSSFNSVTTTSNNAPSISGSPATTASEGAAYKFSPKASDPEGDSLVFSIANKPSWMSFNASTGELSGVAGYTAAGTYGNIVITVSDGNLAASLPAFTITVTNTNRAPTIGGTPSSSVASGAVYSFTPTAQDADNDVLAFSIQGKPSWASFNTKTGQLSGTPVKTDAGSYSNISISVSDGQGVATLPAFSIAVTYNNNAPVISGVPGSMVNEGQAYSFTPTASDADGDVLIFSILNKPSWASFNTKTGQLSGTPAYDQSGTYGGIRISVSDGSNVVSLSDFSITVANKNRVPVISGSPAGSVTVGSAYLFTPAGSDPDGDALTFSIQNKPVWASFDTKTGALSGTPASGDVASYGGITISVSDGTATASLPAFAITVSDSNHAPVISGSGSANITAGTAYSFTPSASDADGDTLTFSIQNKPVWAGFDTKTGALTGTPTTADVALYSNIVISVSDGTKMVNLAAFAIQVSASVPTRTVTISWTAPSTYEDGGSLTISDIGGYRIYHGTSANNLALVADINDGSTLSHVVNNLATGQTHYFAVTIYDQYGVESVLSSVFNVTL